MHNPFTSHPRSVGLGYWRHMFGALRYGGLAMTGGIAAIIHAIFPFLFEATLSSTVARLHQEFSERHRNLQEK